MDRLARLIDSFLELSKGSGEGSIDLVPETFDAGELVEEAVNLVRAATGKCEFRTHFGPGVDKLRADREKILLVLVNLLTNADHYSPAGGTVDVRVARADGGLRFEVTSHRMKIPK